MKRGLKFKIFLCSGLDRINTASLNCFRPIGRNIGKISGSLGQNKAGGPKNYLELDFGFGSKKKFAGGGLQGFGEPFHIYQANISLSPFNRSDVGAMEICPFSQGFL